MNQPKADTPSSRLVERLRTLADDYDGMGRSHPVSDGLREAADRIEALERVAEAARLFRLTRERPHICVSRPCPWCGVTQALAALDKETP